MKGTIVLSQLSYFQTGEDRLLESGSLDTVGRWEGASS